MSCSHDRVAPVVCDQTLGVKCLVCNHLLGCCWMDEHVSEELWNRACQNSSDAKPCEKSRTNVCFLCEEPFTEPERGV